MNNSVSYYYQFSTSELDRKRLDKQPSFDILYPRKLTPDDKHALAILKQEEVKNI